MADKSILIMGYGNPAREDDGLGPAAAEYIESLSLDGVTADANYQLSIEDAAEVAEHDCSVFVDAAVEGEEPFYFKRLTPDTVWQFTSHSVNPETVAALAKDLFGAGKECYLLGIRGYSFEMFKEGLTEKAAANLEKAKEFLVGFVQEGGNGSLPE